MTDKRDPELQALFAASHQELGGDEIVANVVAAIQQEKRRIRLLQILLAVFVVALLWLFAPFFVSLTSLVNHTLTTPLININSTFMMEFLSPLNSFGFVTVMIVMMVNKFRKKLFGIR